MNISRPTGSNKFAHIQRGYYKVGNSFYHFRSKWEANYAIYLEWLRGRGEIANWEFEKQTFWFEAIRRGVRSYCPDFRITKNNGAVEFHEVKGYMDSKSNTKIKRMAKYYPDVKLIVVDQASYKDIRNKLGKVLKFYL